MSSSEPANKAKHKQAVLLASSNTALTDRITTLLDQSFRLATTRCAAGLEATVDQFEPQLVMLDPTLFGDELQKVLSTIFVHRARIRVIILEDEVNHPVDQLGLFKSGVHGFLSHGISSELLQKAAHAVCGGEVWVPRQLIARLVGELARDTTAGTHTLKFAGNTAIEHLTPREMQVAEMVHGGGNNKTIARTLDISERTVKAHLSAIFRKLDIENRLHLALYFSQLK